MWLDAIYYYLSFYYWITQIQNITAGPICLESVELESSESYTAQSLNTLPNGESVFKSKNMLEPQNSCQFLYCIRPIAALTADPKALKLANNIGKLDIIWRSNLGERGRLQTSQLQRNVSKTTTYFCRYIANKEIVLSLWNTVTYV